LYNNEKINVFLQRGSLRNRQHIISIKDFDIQRGSVALATNDSDGIYFDSVSVQNIETFKRFHSVNNRRDWDSCI